MQHRALKYYQVFSNDDTGWPFTFLCKGQVWFLMLLYGKMPNGGFLRTITVYDVKVGLYCKPNEHMQTYVLEVKVIFYLGPRPLRFHCCQHFQTASFQKPMGESVKFLINPPWDWGINLYSNYLGHMTKTVVIPIYGKNLLESFSSEPNDWYHWNLVYSIGHSSTTKLFNNDPRLTVDLFI